MKERNSFKKISLVIFLFVVLIISLTSCMQYEKKETDMGFEINISSDDYKFIFSINKTNKSDDEGADEKKEAVAGEEEEKKQEETGTQEEITIPKRASEVEFYFLLKGKSYFKHFLRENQVKIYNVSGVIITIEPIIITSDSVKFRINDFTTKALGEEDSDSTQEFEIIVKDIYYRG